MNLAFTVNRNLSNCLFIYACSALGALVPSAPASSFDFFETGGTFYHQEQMWEGVAFSDSGSLQAQLINAVENKARPMEINLEDGGYLRVPHQGHYMAVYAHGKDNKTKLKRFRFRFPEGVRGRVWIGASVAAGHQLPPPSDQDTQGEVWKSYSSIVDGGRWVEIDSGKPESVDLTPVMNGQSKIPDAAAVLLFGYVIVDDQGKPDADSNHDLHIQVASGSE